MFFILFGCSSLISKGLFCRSHCHWFNYFYSTDLTANCRPVASVMGYCNHGNHIPIFSELDRQFSESGKDPGVFVKEIRWIGPKDVLSLGADLIPCRMTRGLATVVLSITVIKFEQTLCMVVKLTMILEVISSLWFWRWYARYGFGGDDGISFGADPACRNAWSFHNAEFKITVHFEGHFW